MNRREKQLDNNLTMIFAMYFNGMTDCGEAEYPALTEQECIDYAYEQVFDMKDNGYGVTEYLEGICDDLKFLGSEYIKDRILDIAAEEGVLKI